MKEVQSSSRTHLLENREEKTCEEEDIPHIALGENTQNRKYKWFIEYDFIFVDGRYKLSSETVGEIQNMIENRDIEHRTSSLTPNNLGSNPRGYTYFEFTDKKKAKDIAEEIESMIENQENWVEIEN